MGDLKAALTGTDRVNQQASRRKPLPIDGRKQYPRQENSVKMLRLLQGVI